MFAFQCVGLLNDDECGSIPQTLPVRLVLLLLGYSFSSPTSCPFLSAPPPSPFFFLRSKTQRAADINYVSPNDVILPRLHQLTR